ncbi:MAG: hypothetical protein J6C41_03970 [Oscillospiraceae bacterium]|nr:hypothetical protein [Oscillospiraceae bacterium]
MAKRKTKEVWKKHLQAAIIGLIIWLLYLVNREQVEMIDWRINVEFFDSWSKNGICSFLAKFSLVAAIINGFMAVGHFVQYTKAPTVLCPACGLTYKDEVGDGVCPYCGKNRNDFKKTDSAQIPKWLCSCGAVHPGYVSTCSCGKTKREGTKIDPQPLPKQVESAKHTINNDQWQCSCGRVHREYVYMCICGRKKRYTTELDQQPGSKQAEQTNPMINDDK